MEWCELPGGMIRNYHFFRFTSEFRMLKVVHSKSNCRVKQNIMRLWVFKICWVCSNCTFMHKYSTFADRVCSFSNMMKLSFVREWWENLHKNINCAWMNSWRTLLLAHLWIHNCALGWPSLLSHIHEETIICWKIWKWIRFWLLRRDRLPLALTCFARD